MFGTRLKVLYKNVKNKGVLGNFFIRKKKSAITILIISDHEQLFYSINANINTVQCILVQHSSHTPFIIQHIQPTYVTFSVIPSQPCLLCDSIHLSPSKFVTSNH